MTKEQIIKIILKCYSKTIAIYLFGSFQTKMQWTSSDVDIALLLPWHESKQIGSLVFSDCKCELEELLGKSVDLVNLRNSNSVFQNEIINTGRLLYCSNEYLKDEFEMLVLSFYQKLNEERKEILQSFYKTGRAYDL